MVFEKVKEILSAQFEVAADSITLDTDIVEGLGADSLDYFDEWRHPEIICQKAREKNKTYVCVITYDRDFISH